MENNPPVEIPIEMLSPEALVGVMNDFIVRDGTDYGYQEITHDKKLEQLRRQIVKGDVKIVFDAASESVTLMTQKDWHRFIRLGNDPNSSNSLGLDFIQRPRSKS